MRSKEARNRRNKGFTLIETLMAAVILSVTALSMTSMIANLNREILSLKKLGSRDGLRFRIDRYSGNPAALLQSANNIANPMLKNCVLGGGPPCTTPAPVALTLLDPTGNTLAPNLYDINGAPCTPAGPQCMIQALASFTATCPGAPPPPASCPVARSITVTYTIQQEPTTTGSSSGVAMRSVTATITTDVAAINSGGASTLGQTGCFWTGWADWSSGPQICPIGYYVAGQDQRDCGSWHDCERVYCCQP